jgi:hypothetical protein
VAIVEGGRYNLVDLAPGRAGVRPPEVAPAAPTLSERSAVEVRDVTRRYIVVDGKPVGPPLEEAVPLEGPPPPR